jgi:diguanylate cyclase (GGDEF)-like protein/PAS domain S-box-containing protein
MSIPIATRFVRPLLPGWRQPSGIAVSWILGIYVAIYLAWLVGPLSGLGDRAQVAVVAILPVRFAGVWLALAVARSARVDRATRRAWGYLAVALLTYAVGTTLAAAATLAGFVLPYPSIADLALLAFYPLTFLGLVLLPSQRGTRVDRARLAFDALIWTVGGGLVIWFVVIGSIQGALTGDPAALATTVAYPLGDLLILSGLATTILRRSPLVDRRAMVLLVAGIGALFVDDLAWSYFQSTGSYAPGHPVDGLWMLSALLLALAARVQLDARPLRVVPDAEAGRYRVSLTPYAFLVAGYLALVVHSDPGLSSGTRDVVIGTAMLGAFVIGRQLLALRENANLLEDQAERRSQARFSSYIEHASDVIAVIGPGDIIRYLSPAVERVLGYEAEQLLGTRLPDLATTTDGRPIQSLSEVTGRSQSVRLAWRMLHADAHFIDVEVVMTDLRADLNVAGFVLNLRDISERRTFEDQLIHQTLHDGLTSLANRVLFRDRVGHALDRRRGQRGRLAVLFVDLDDFKKVNDALGHAAGDDLLGEVAQRLRDAVRSADTVARLGGDEFGILLEDLDDDESIACAERIGVELGKPFPIRGRSIELGASIGIALHDGRSSSADDLLRDADVAMYRAKAAGKGCHAVFTQEMHVAADERLKLETDLRGAIERREFKLEYQPVVDLANGRLASTEALLRWHHPVRGLLPPMAFIPLAESTGLIVPIGRWVLFEACRQLAAWHAQRPNERVSLSLNLSARQLKAPGLLEDVAESIARYGLLPGELILEVTESLLIEEQGAAAETLGRLRALGARIAIDDFGTGYSALAYLHRFPADILKIDKAFVDGLDGDREHHDVAAAVVQIGHALGMRIVAEGVEREGQLDRLRDMGCDQGQGYLLGRPMAPDAFDAWQRRDAARWRRQLNKSGASRSLQRDRAG